MAKGEFQLYIENTFPKARVTQVRKIPTVFKILLREKPTLLKIEMDGNSYLLSSCGKVTVAAPPELSTAHHTWLSPYFRMHTLFKEIYQDSMLDLLRKSPFLKIAKETAKQQLPYGPIFSPTPLPIPGEKKQKANSNKKK